MVMHPESNACSTCARSKRKCDRKTPSCSRCADSGRPCTYPMSKTKVASARRPLLSNTSKSATPGINHALLDDIPTHADSSIVDLSPIADPTFESALPLPLGQINASLSLDRMPSILAVKPCWFLSPETWMIARNPATIPAPKETMKNILAVLQSWFKRWISTGSNPFIHSSLYSTKFPACVQVAYTTLASYLHGTPANTNIVLQIVEDRSTDLLLENGATLDSNDPDEWVTGPELDDDLFVQLSRLHALMVYQVIGLFDGDIRARHVAEGRMAVQHSWANKLFHSAATVLSNNPAPSTYLVGCFPEPRNHSQQQWYLWILTESIRRTWLVAVSISTVFYAMQRGWLTCPGGIVYTNHSGIWNAKNATDWENRCTEEGVAFSQRFECATLLDDVEMTNI